MYDAVPSLLSASIRLSAFPDGSVDTYRRVRDPGGGWLTEAEFRERLTGARSRELRVRTRAVEPGGQAVNAARQAHALGDDVRLDGCLDDDRLAFPFETHSVGPPARVDVHEFADGDVLYVEEGDALREWTHEAFPTVPEADAHVCANWASVDGMTGSLRALAGDLEGVFVFDPGNLGARPASAVRDCADALAALEHSAEVAVSVNGPELSALSDALGVDEDPSAVRDEAGVSAVVRHESEAATVATRTADVEVPNFECDAVRRTGGGDRFSAGFAHGLATGGDAAAAAALGNCCASYYVTTGETGTPEALREFLDERGRP